MKNLKIETKVFMLMIIFSVTIIFVHIMDMRALNTIILKTDTVSIMKDEYGEFLFYTRESKDDKFDSALKKVEIASDEIIKTANQYKDAVNEKSIEFEALSKIQNYFNSSTKYTQKHFELLRDLDPTEEEYFDKYIDGPTEDVDVSISELEDAMKQEANATRINNSLVVAIVVIGLFFLSFFLIFKPLRKGITSLSSNANNIANGNFNLSLDISRGDELGTVAQCISKVKDTLLFLIADLNELIQNDLKGNIKLIDVSRYLGSFEELAKGVNNLVITHQNDTTEILNCMNEIGNGNFNASIKSFPGDKSKINDVIEGIRSNLKKVIDTILLLTTKVSSGDLAYRVEESGVNGDWATVTSELNKLLNACILPIENISYILERFENGDFSKKMEGDFKGDFKVIQNRMNGTTNAVSSYINEISTVLTAISQNDLTVDIKRDYKCDFADIKYAINLIISNLNNIIGSINSASEQISLSSEVMAQSSGVIAKGSEEQADKIQSLIQFMNLIEIKASENSESALQANKFSSEQLKKNAEQSEEGLQGLLNEMNVLELAFQYIMKITDIIESIAFELDILGINSAIQAASVGNTGNGFNVVSEQIRVLAQKTDASATEISQNINDAHGHMNHTGELIHTERETLKVLLESVSKIIKLILKISKDSTEQLESVEQCKKELNNINFVVRENVNSCQKTAALSEELSTAAQNLYEIIIRFKLKN